MLSPDRTERCKIKHHHMRDRTIPNNDWFIINKTVICGIGSMDTKGSLPHHDTMDSAGFGAAFTKKQLTL